MRIVLAPMEGLADVHLRRLITCQGGFDWVVSEFLRVVDMPLPDHTFYSICPELKRGGVTESSTPVRVQLLGSDVEAMAINAQRAVALGSFGVDLNFGCPSKTVNRRQGGAALLREPQTLFEVVSAVRAGLPKNVVVSAKMRLGFEDTSLMLDNARAIEAGGANELTVHARTRVQGYAPPAHWHEIQHIVNAVSIPVIANGDIWSVPNYHQCISEAGTQDVMLGRGAVRQPDLAARIRANENHPADWLLASHLLREFWAEIRAVFPPRYCAGRLKQWVNHLRHVHPPAEELWLRIRAERCPITLEKLLGASLDYQGN